MGQRDDPLSSSPASPLPVSVLIPAYNRAGMVGRAVASALAQSPRPPAEVIVVDDCSTDDTAGVAASLGARVIRHERNLGEGASRNTALEAAAQPWVALLDSDDEWLPHLLATLWPLRGEHVLVAGASLNCRADSGGDRYAGPTRRRPLVLNSPRRLIYPENFIAASGALVRRDMARAVGGYDPKLRWGADLDLWVRVIERGSAVVAPAVVVLYHLHPGQVTHDRSVLADGAVALLRSYAGRAWFSPGDLTRWEGAVAWDDLRHALRAGRRRTAAGRALALARHPQRLAGAAGIIARRWRLRRRSWQVTRTGAPTMAILTRNSQAGRRVAQRLGAGQAVMGPDEGAGLARSLWRLARRPAGLAVVDTRTRAVLVRALGMGVIRAEEP